MQCNGKACTGDDSEKACSRKNLSTAGHALLAKFKQLETENDLLRKQLQESQEKVASLEAALASAGSQDPTGHLPPAPKPCELQEFERYLESHGVDVSQFGVGTKKSLYQFYVEVKELRRSSLQEVPCSTGNGGVELLRVMHILEIRLVAEVHKQLRVLTCTEQFLDDGRSRKVNQHLVHPIRKGEQWQEVLPRAFLERLGIESNIVDKCFRLDEGSELHKESLRWSQGYPIRTLYKVCQVTMRVLDLDFPDSDEMGLPNGNTFISREGIMGTNQRGRLHVWAWMLAEEDKDKSANVVSTGYEDLYRDLQEAENLIVQTCQHPDVCDQDLDAPLSLALEKIQISLGKIMNVDSMLADVNVESMMFQKRQSGVSNALSEYISSNFTRKSVAFGSRKYGNNLSEILGDGHDRHASLDLTAAMPWMEVVFEKRNDWNLNLFELHEQSGQMVLQSYGEVIFGPLCERALQCGRDDAQEFLEKIASLYHTNPYHNAVHATQVCHAARWLSRSIGLTERQTGKENAAFIIAALCHDIKHFGRTNAFCVSSQHDLALLYNDMRVLENMHAATCINILYGSCDRKSEIGCKNNGLLAGVSAQDRLSMRSQIIQLILSTDMAEHFETISKFRVRRDATDFEATNEADRRFLAQMCMKAGDLCHGALNWELHQQWSLQVNKEFMDQGDEERRLGLPVSALCDRRSLEDLGKSQRGFLEFVCLPLYEELAVYQSSMLESQECAFTSESRASTARASTGFARTRRKTTRAAKNSSKKLLQATTVQNNCILQIEANAERWVEDPSVVALVLEQLSLSGPEG